jgi:hypothetical protein
MAQEFKGCVCLLFMMEINKTDETEKVGGENEKVHVP